MAPPVRVAASPRFKCDAWSIRAVNRDNSLQLLSIRHDRWHRRCFVSLTGHPCLRQGEQHEKRIDHSARPVRDDGLGGGIRHLRIGGSRALIPQPLSRARRRPGAIRRGSRRMAMAAHDDAAARGEA
jgi:hypothetical protein